MILAIVLIIAIFLINTGAVFADFTFSIPQTTITSDQEIDASVILSLQGQNNKVYYLEGAFRKEDSTNYFGLSWNDSAWVKYTASNYSTLKSITTDSSGKRNETIKIKIDEASSLFTGSGNYILRMKRFTSAGSPSWSDNSITLTVKSSSSSTPSPSPSPTVSTTSSSTSSTSSNSTTSTFTISNIPSGIDSSETISISVNLHLSEYPDTIFYLKGAFKKDNSSNYFGKTLVGSDWVKNGNSYSSQYKITTDSTGKWEGNLEIQPDVLDSGYDGSGNYLFKVGRYSSSGSGPSWSNETSINISSKEILLEEDEEITEMPTSTKAVDKSSSKITIPEEVYSSEKYAQKLATDSSKESSIAGEKTENTKNQNDKFIYLPIILGILLITAGVGWHLRTILIKAE